MNREEAISLVRENVTKENLFKHILAVEAIMRGVAKHLNEDVETWGLVGLLHDIDYDQTENDPKNHATVAAKLLDGKVEEKIIRAIKSHNFEHTGVIPETKMEKALVAADAISGLIVATALIIPSKKLNDVKVKSIKKKFKQKDFARNCSRERILVCKHVGIPEEKFFEITLEAMQGISEELDL